MADESTSYSDLISRRRFVELTGVTGAAALAGCDGDGDSTDTEDPSGNGTDEMTDDGTPTEPDNFYPDVEHVSVETGDTSELQFNPINSTGAPEIADRIIFEKWAQYSYAEGDYLPAGLEEWGLEDGTFTMTIKDGLTWSNGEEVTTDDMLIQLGLMQIDEDPAFQFISDYEAVDDKTMELSVENVNPVLIEANLFSGTTRMFKIDEETYGEWLDELQNNEAEIEDLRNFADEDPITSGPFEFDSKNDQQVVTTHVRDGDGENPWAENINFGTYTFTAGGNNQQRLNALRSLEVDSDFSLAVGARTLAGFPDPIEEANYYDVWGFGIYPNHNHQHAGDRAVRQAVAYAINRQQCVNNSLPRAKIPTTYEVGISDADGNQENWLGDSDIEYETYGVDSVMTDQVDQVMQDAGYSKVDGTWTDEDGNTVSLPVTCPSGWGDWVDQAETIVANLQEAGFESEFDGQSGFGSAGTPLTEGDFVLGAGPWLHGGPLTHPYFSLQHQLTQLQIAGQEVKGNYPGWTEQWGGSQASITVESPDGDEWEVDVNARIEELANTTDGDTEQEIIEELAWVSNVDLPTIPIVDKVLQQWLTNDDWTVPENADTPHSSVQFAPTWLPRQGEMNWRGN